MSSDTHPRDGSVIYCWIFNTLISILNYELIKNRHFEVGSEWFSTHRYMFDNSDNSLIEDCAFPFCIVLLNTRISPAGEFYCPIRTVYVGVLTGCLLRYSTVPDLVISLLVQLVLFTRKQTATKICNMNAIFFLNTIILSQRELSLRAGSSPKSRHLMILWHCPPYRHCG